ncbi:hypothetical protein PIB30_063687 [Stylosanthes scabra]|uniref:ADP-ribosyl cyclase/cyclic ADP-ribose hydrolase n=1 Tax=Stylosanthes scabra TaxID=79078 RepID=A0ABU6WPB1_9FABA|nr:hypothetical protein [Stylosanthes scabra]
MSYQSEERTPDPSWKYDVFLSFQGPDTRRGFISRLYQALKISGIHAFVDDDVLRSPEGMSYTMSQAIEASRVSVVVFSENYAASRWCLDEVTKIVECGRSIGQAVIPVFYNVDPADIQNQRGPYYGEDFQRHQERSSDERVQAWRAALTEAANLPGFNITGKSF